MSGLTNNYVQRLMYKISPNPQNFHGVLPCDQFLNLMSKSQGNWKCGDCFILNLSASGHRGSHFVAVYLTSKSTAEYFDSYALSHSIDNNLKQAFDIAGLQIQESTKRIQGDASQFCGFYCVAFLLYRQVDLPAKSFEDAFSSVKLTQNDSIVVELLKKFIEESH